MFINVELFSVFGGVENSQLPSGGPTNSYGFSVLSKIDQCSHGIQLTNKFTSEIPIVRRTPSDRLNSQRRFIRYLRS